MRTNELMLYKNMDYGDILSDMTFLMENHGNDYYNTEDLRSLLFESVNSLLEFSVEHGFKGNLWHTYLTFLLVNDENAYSTSCEIVGPVMGSINEIAFHDFEVFKSYLTMIFLPLKGIWMRRASRRLWITICRMERGRYLTAGSETVSVVSLRSWARSRMWKIFTV